MRTPDQLTTLFRANGLRVTEQRQHIFRALHGNDRHPTVESLYDTVRANVPSISLKTVYQTVHDLAALGEVDVLDLGTGSVRIDPNVDGTHHHLVCRDCGKVRDVRVEPGRTEPAAPSARLRQGFRVQEIDVIYRGLCAACLAHKES